MRLPTPTARGGLAVILALQLVVGVPHALLKPLWQGHEADFYNVVRLIANEGRLPSADDYPPGEAAIRQATQPPLYFLVALPIVAAFSDDQPVPPPTYPNLICIGGESANALFSSHLTLAAQDFPFQGAVAAQYALRLLSLGMLMLTTWLTYRAGRVLFPDRVSVALGAAALIAFEPNLHYTLIAVSNDALMLLVAAAGLYFTARAWMSPRRQPLGVFFMLAVLALAATLTRLNGWGMIIINGLGMARIIWAQLARRGVRLWWIGASAAAFAVGIAIIGATNTQLYGTIFGRYEQFAELTLQPFTDPGTLMNTAGGVLRFSASAHLEAIVRLEPRAAVLRAVQFIGLLALVGLGWGLIVRLRRHARAYGLLLLVCALTFWLVLARNIADLGGAQVTSYHVGLIFAPLRYYALGLAAFALLLSAGLDALTLSLPFKLATAAVAGTWLVLAAAAVIVFAVQRPPAPQTPPADLAFSVPDRQAQIDAFGSALPYVTGIYSTAGRAPGMTEVTLLAAVDAASAQPYIGELRLTDAQGQVVTSCQFAPGYSVYPTSRWQPGEVVASHVSLPNCAAADAPLTLALRWIGFAPSTEPSTWVDLGSITPAPGIAAGCPQTLGLLADGYRVTKFNSPPTARRAEPYLPSLNWIVEVPSSDVLRRTLIFTHEQSGVEYTCSGSPSDAMKPLASWQRGEYIYFDYCEMQFPPDAPLGEYRVAVQIENRDGRAMPGVDAAGAPAERIPVGAFTLVE